MVIRAIICLLAVSVTQGSVIQNSLSGSLSSILQDASPMSSLSSMKELRMATTDWDAEYDFTKLGLHIKLKYVDPAHILKGVHVFVGFTVPPMLQQMGLKEGLTELEFDLLAQPQLLKGVFDMKIGYTIVRNGAPIMGTVDVSRSKENGKHITKIVINGEDSIILDLSLDTDMKNKMVLSGSMAGKAYSLRFNRVRGEIFIVSHIVNGMEYSLVVSPNLLTKRINIHSTVGRSKTHEAEITYNPISLEWGVYIEGNVYGPLDCRFILQKDLKFAQIIVNHNKINYAYLNIDGKMKMASLLPMYFKYAIIYDLHQGRLGAGRAKVAFNGLDVEKVLSVSMAPKTGHAYDFEMKVNVGDDYSFDITHELTSGKEILYTASHKHVVAINTPQKWMSFMTDKCAVPKTSPLSSIMRGTYLGDLLGNMRRKMAVEIDWTTRVGYLYKGQYTDTISVNGAKHLVVSLSTKASPLTFMLHYPKGPLVGGINLGLQQLLGQDALNAVLTYDEAQQKLSLQTDIDNLTVDLVLPNLTKKLSMVITHSKLNEKAFQCDIYKDGTAVKVNAFSSFSSPKIPYLCNPTAPSTSCQWTGQLNFDINLAAKISGVIPVHSLVMSLTKDYVTLIEVRNNMNQSPYFLRLNCPFVLPMPLDVQITNVIGKQMTVKFADYLPGEVVVDIIGTLHVIKYEGYELASLDLDLTNKRVAYGLGLIPTPICIIQYAADDLLKNTMTVNVEVPMVGKVLTGTVEWAIKDVLNLALKAIAVGNIPIIGAFALHESLMHAVALPRRPFTYTAPAALTKGLTENWAYSSACPINGVTGSGKVLDIRKASIWQKCGNLCFLNSKCEHWTFWETNCYLYESIEFTNTVSGSVAGSRLCPVEDCAHAHFDTWFSVVSPCFAKRVNGPEIYNPELCEAEPEHDMKTIIDDAIDQLDSDVKSSPVLQSMARKMHNDVPEDYRDHCPGDFSSLITYLKIVATITPPFLTTAPAYFVGVPITTVLLCYLHTQSGRIFFADSLVNNHMIKIVNLYGDLLSSKDSLTVLNDLQYGWKSKCAKELLHMEQFIYDASDPNWGFSSFNEFFTRPLKEIEVSRPCDTNPYVLTSVGDVAYFNEELHVTFETNLYMKNEDYSLKQIFNNDEIASEFVGGAILQTYFAGYKYHRYHAPIDGIIVHAQKKEGIIYAIDEVNVNVDKHFTAGKRTSAQEKLDLWIKYGVSGMLATELYLAHAATRCIYVIDSPTLGKVGLVFIGMTEISSCTMAKKVGDSVKKGEELGKFQFGGSSGLVALQEKTVKKAAIGPNVWSEMGKDTTWKMCEKVVDLSPTDL